MSQTNDPHLEPDLEQVLDCYHSLLAAWRGYVQSNAIRIRRGTNQGKFYVSYSFCAHTFKQGENLRRLLAADATAECMPQLRSMFEFAITAQWVVQVDQAVEAFLTRSLREKRKTIETIPALRLPGGDSDAALRAMSEIDEEPSTGPLRADFKNICLDLAEPAGEPGYARYRLMSAYCHPSDFMIEFYLDFQAEGDVFMKVPPTLPPLSGWASTALASLMWAAAAVDFVDPKHGLRPILQKAETLLGVTRVLRPSDRVFKRSSAS